MKNLVKIFLFIGLLSSLNAKEFSWYKFKQDNQIKSKNSGKNYIKQKYDMSVEKKSIKDMKDEASHKTLFAGFDMRGDYQYKEDPSSDKLTDGANFGFFLKGKISFDALGYPMENLYSTARLFPEDVSISIDYRIVNTKRFYVDASFGFDIRTSQDKKMDLYSALTFGYNFDTWGIAIEQDFFSSNDYMDSENKRKAGLLFQVYKSF